MLNLCTAENVWYYRNPEKAKILYVGKKQQLELTGYFETGLWYAADDKWHPLPAPSKLTQYSGYKVVYVDEEDYLKFGD